MTGLRGNFRTSFYILLVFSLVNLKAKYFYQTNSHIGKNFRRHLMNEQEKDKLFFTA